jgi:predicted nucleic acid-binding protein
MTSVLIDSNILLDVMTEDPRWFSWSAESLERAANRFRLVINPIIYAEVSIRYSKIEELNAALPRRCSVERLFLTKPRFRPGNPLSHIGDDVDRSSGRFRIFHRRPRSRFQI